MEAMHSEGEPSPAPSKKWDPKKHAGRETLGPSGPEGLQVEGWICGADVEPEDVKWLWYPYIPAGKLTSIEGHPGVGKSWILANLAATITSGRPFPAEKGWQSLPPQNVIMLSGEDGLEDTMVPRLILSGANMKRVYFPGGVWTLTPDNIDRIKFYLKLCVAAIIFIDPIQLFMGSKVDMNKANEVRGLMHALHETATESGCSIVIVRHLKKGADNPLEAGLGSMDFVASVRSVIHVSRNKLGDTVFEQVKNNLGPLGKPLQYALDPEQPTKPFRWCGHYMDTQRGSVIEGSESVNKAGAWLEAFLQAGPRTAEEVWAAGEEAKISKASLVRAKLQIGRSVKVGKVWMWELSSKGVAESSRVESRDGEAASGAGEGGECTPSPPGPAVEAI